MFSTIEAAAENPSKCYKSPLYLSPFTHEKPYCTLSVNTWQPTHQETHSCNTRNASNFTLATKSPEPFWKDPHIMKPYIITWSYKTRNTSRIQEKTDIIADLTLKYSPRIHKLNIEFIVIINLLESCTFSYKQYPLLPLSKVVEKILQYCFLNLLNKDEEYESSCGLKLVVASETGWT